MHKTIYHPQANGMVERMRRILKVALKCTPETLWNCPVLAVLLDLRTIFKEDLQTSPTETVFSTSLRMPREFIQPTPRGFISDLSRLFNAIRSVSSSQQPYIGPHRVVQRFNDQISLVDINGVEKTLSTDHLKPAYMEQVEHRHPPSTPSPLSSPLAKPVHEPVSALERC